MLDDEVQMMIEITRAPPPPPPEKVVRGRGRGRGGVGRGMRSRGVGGNGGFKWMYNGREKMDRQMQQMLIMSKPASSPSLWGGGSMGDMSGGQSGMVHMPGPGGMVNMSGPPQPPAMINIPSQQQGLGNMPPTSVMGNMPPSSSMGNMPPMPPTSGMVNVPLTSGVDPQDPFATLPPVQGPMMTPSMPGNNMSYNTPFPPPANVHMGMMGGQGGPGPNMMSQGPTWPNMMGPGGSGPNMMGPGGHPGGPMPPIMSNWSVEGQMVKQPITYGLSVLYPPTAGAPPPTTRYEHQPVKHGSPCYS